MNELLSRPPISEFHGILSYATEDHYWGVSPRDELRSMLDAAYDIGFTKAVEDFWGNLKYKAYVTAPDRADFLFYLPIDKSATILDLGSGYGNNTIPLARHFSHVVAADATRELLEYNSLRAKEAGLDNLTYVHIDPLESSELPFKKESFDAIVISGLLEWIGAAKTAESPQTYQQRTLERLKPLLKKNGVLYIGIENRWFPGYLGRDPHSKLRYTSILPRPLADIYARWKGLKDGYRTYIYGTEANRRKLTKAGFKNISFLYPLPTYRNPHHILPHDPHVWTYILANNNLHRFFTSKWIAYMRILAPIEAQYHILPAFMLLCTAPDVMRTLPYAISRAISEGIKDVRESDIFLKIDNDPSQDHASFLVFHKGSPTPHTTLRMRRLPKEGENIIESHHS